MQITTSNNKIYLRFTDIPDEEIRTQLKGEKWWWNYKEKHWEKFKSDDNLKFAMELQKKSVLSIDDDLKKNILNALSFTNPALESIIENTEEQNGKQHDAHIHIFSDGLSQNSEQHVGSTNSGIRTVSHDEGELETDSKQISVNLRSTGRQSLRNVRQECLNILLKSDDEITEKDKKNLAKYEGAGGLKEKESSTSGILYEFYTPDKIIKKVWKLVDSYAPNAKTVLEPCGGTGRFVLNRLQNEITLHEIDEISARIAQIINPKATVYQGAFQKQFFDENERVHKKNLQLPQYDVVIGNPPYGRYQDKWKGLGEGKDHTKYEEYFIEKGLDSLKPGGILAYVVPSGFLRNKESKIKERIASKGKLLDAWRLPNGAFPTTDVATDIIILSKEKGRLSDYSNDYFFKKNRAKILGDEIIRSSRFGDELAVKIPEDTTFEKLLSRIKPNKIRFNVQQLDLFSELEEIDEISKSTNIKTKAVEKLKVPEEVEQTPSPSSCLSIENFCKKYDKKFNISEQKLWQSTESDGYVNLDKTDDTTQSYLNSDESDYIQAAPSRWIHKIIYASGNIEDKINELTKLHEQSIVTDEIFKANKEILTQSLPEKIKIENISFSPQSSLAKEFTVNESKNSTIEGSVSLIRDFILWAEGATRYYKYQFGHSIDFADSPLKREDIPDNIEWQDIINYLEGEPVRARTSYDDESRKIAALEAEKKRSARRDTADKLFNRYLQEGLPSKTKIELENEWNKRFNSYVAPDYSKLPLYINGMSQGKGKSMPEFYLYNQQIKGISFLCNKGNGLLAYGVGVGKTASGIVATVSQIQTGLSKRPLIVVPKSVYSKWIVDCKELFPNIKINELGNFSKDDLANFKKNTSLKIEEGSISICSNEALQKISFNDESIKNVLQDDFANLLGIDLSDIKNDKERSQALEKISREIGLAAQSKDGFVFWEETGFDHITVDEAHRFKNLFRVPRSKNSERGKANEYAGLGSGKPSARALKLFAMTQLTQEMNDDRNVFLLTATPFTNSPLEVYSMMSYIARKKLKEMHIHDIKDFLNEYAEMKTEWSISPKGDIQPKQVMKNFRSLKSLQNFLTEYIDKVDADEAGVLRPRKITHVQDLNTTDLQKQIIAFETKRMLNPNSAKNGGFLVAMNNMRMGMLSPALLRANNYPFDIPSLNELVKSSPKLKFVCNSVADCYKEVPNGGQIIYMPRGVKESVYLKSYLVEKGIPKDAITFLNSSTTSSQKDKITQEFNDKNNPLKIIIGSETISEGVDLNGNTYALYNTMLGWNPTETIQVEGRLWRQGNKQGHTHIVYPLMNDSIDSLMYQKHDEKGSRINALWSYKGDKLNVEDINAEELKFDLIKDPKVKADFIIGQKISAMQRDEMILSGQIKTIDELEKRKNQLDWDISYGSTYKQPALEKVQKKLLDLGVKNDSCESIKKRKEELQEAQCEFLDKIKNIKETKESIIAELSKKEEERISQTLPNRELQKNLSQAILTNLKTFESVKQELKLEQKAKAEKPQTLADKMKLKRIENKLKTKGEIEL